jgi:DNA-directed RNA polymerase sigma subunit (sigma70/sigma32)
LNHDLLTPLETWILIRRCRKNGRPIPYRKLARDSGLSQERIKKIEREALAKLNGKAIGER